MMLSKTKFFILDMTSMKKKEENEKKIQAPGMNDFVDLAYWCMLQEAQTLYRWESVRHTDTS